MSHTLRISRKLFITPLCDIHWRDVVHAYVAGLSKSLSTHREPVPVSFLVRRLQHALSIFDGRHQAAARAFVGSHLGMMHGAILTETGSTRENVTTLAVLDTIDARRGYRAGRHWFFYEALPHERRFTDDEFIERLYEVAENSAEWGDNAEQVWRYIIACSVGELSGQVFPLTQEEQARWNEQERAARTALAQQDARRGTELLASLPVAEYTL